MGNSLKKKFQSRSGNQQNGDIELQSEPTHQQGINLAELISDDMIKSRIGALGANGLHTPQMLIWREFNKFIRNGGDKMSNVPDWFKSYLAAMEDWQKTGRYGMGKPNGPKFLDRMLQFRENYQNWNAIKQEILQERNNGKEVRRDERRKRKKDITDTWALFDKENEDSELNIKDDLYNPLRQRCLQGAAETNMDSPVDIFAPVEDNVIELIMADKGPWHGSDAFKDWKNQHGQEYVAWLTQQTGNANKEYFDELSGYMDSYDAGKAVFGDYGRSLYHDHNGHYHGHQQQYLQSYYDGYHNDYHYGYGTNNDWIVIGLEGIFGLIFMAIIGCICVILAIFAGWIGYTLYQRSHPQNGHRDKGPEANRYRNVVANDSDHI